MKNFKNMKLIGYIVLALITILGIVLIALPSINQSARWSNEIKDAQDKNQALIDQIGGLEQKKKTHSDAVVLNDELSIKFPSAASGTLLLSDISNAASQAGIPASAITAINIATPVLSVAEEAEAAPTNTDKKATKDGETSQEASAPATPKIATMGVEITVNGTNAQLSAFLKSLGQVDRAIKIDDIQLAELDKESPEAFSTMTVVGTTILYKAIDDPAKATTKKTTGTSGSTNSNTTTDTTKKTQ